MSNIITATFKDRYTAESALAELESAGIAESQISLIVSDSTRGRHFSIVEKTKIGEGTATGATIGGLVGAMWAALASASVLVIPGLNLVVTGTLVAALAGLGAGAATGGFVGALVGAGIPEHEARLYEKEVARGSVLIAVEARDADEKKMIKNILKNTEAANIAA